MKIKVELDIADIDLSDKFMKMANHKYNIQEDYQRCFLELFEKSKKTIKNDMEEHIFEDVYDSFLDSFEKHFENISEICIDTMAKKLNLMERKYQID